MNAKVWISLITSNYEIGNKQRTRTKFYGHDWTPPTIEIPVPNETVLAALRCHKLGLTLERGEMTEAIAIWDEKRFKRAGDLFTAGPFYAVKGRLAEVLARCNLGTGGLIPIPVFKADLETRVEGDFYLLNFGGPKDSFLADKSNPNSIPHLAFDRALQRDIWIVSSGVHDGDIVLSSAALSGPDIWFELTLFNKLFLSNKFSNLFAKQRSKSTLSLAHAVWRRER